MRGEVASWLWDESEWTPQLQDVIPQKAGLVTKPFHTVAEYVFISAVGPLYAAV